MFLKKKLKNITFFSEKIWQKLHKLRDRNVKKSFGQLRSKNGKSLGRNDNFPGVAGHMPFLDNWRLTTLYRKTWLWNFLNNDFVWLDFTPNSFIKWFLITTWSIKQHRGNQKAKKKMNLVILRPNSCVLGEMQITFRWSEYWNYNNFLGC